MCKIHSFSELNYIVPLQVWPFSDNTNPFPQLHVYDPAVFVQICWQSFTPAHSLISGKKALCLKRRKQHTLPHHCRHHLKIFGTQTYICRHSYQQCWYRAADKMNCLNYIHQYLEIVRMNDMILCPFTDQYNPFHLLSIHLDTVHM